MSGWECPKCHRCYAPTVRECDVCNRKVLTQPSTPSREKEFADILEQYRRNNPTDPKGTIPEPYVAPYTPVWPYVQPYPYPWEQWTWTCNPPNTVTIGSDGTS